MTWGLIVLGLRFHKDTESGLLELNNKTSRVIFLMLCTIYAVNVNVNVNCYRLQSLNKKVEQKVIDDECDPFDLFCRESPFPLFYYRIDGQKDATI